jgi:hypothetical protein
MGLLLKLVVALQSATLGSQFPLLEGPFLVPFRPLQYFEHCDVLLSHLMQSKYSYFFQPSSSINNSPFLSNYPFHNV